jgi:hypothetical protein
MGGKGSGKINENAIVRLDGTIVEADGSESRTKLFEYLAIDLDDYADIEMTPAEAQRFMNHVRRMKTGVAAFIPKLCPGPVHCTLRKRCPYEARYPIGRACPLEVNYIKVQTKGYIESLEIDPSNTYEMALINELVEYDLIDYRANIALSDDEEGQRLLRTTLIENETSGKMMELINPHPILKVKEDNHKRRLKVLEAFAVTRQQEYKKAAALGQHDKKDASNTIAHVAEMVRKLSSAKTPQDLDKMIEDAKRVSEAGIQEADWQIIEDE